MKKHLPLIYTLVVLLFCGPLKAQTYTVTNWLNNKAAAVSVTLDDGCYAQFSTAMPIMNARNIKGTFYVITDMAHNCSPMDWNFNTSSYWNMVQNAANDGHEIGSHTVTHSDLTLLSTTDVDTELKNSQATINANITTQKCLTLAYPEGKGSKVAGDRDIARNYYIGARGAGCNPSGYDVADYYSNPVFQGDYFYQVESFVVDDSVTTQLYNNIIAGAIQNSGWFIPMYHNIGNSSSLSALTESTANFTANMDAISSNEGSLWIAPFVAVLKYTKERISSSLVEKSSTSNAIVLSLTDGLSNTVFDSPLTVKADNITKTVTSVKQGTNNLNFTQNNTTLTFNAVPDAGDITISFNQVTPVSSVNPLLNGWSLHPNPSAGILSVSYSLKEQENINLAIYHPDGSLVKTLINSSFQAGDHDVSVNAEDLPSGFYFCKLICGDYIDTRKIIIK